MQSLQIGGDIITKNSRNILAINLKYFRFKSNLSQEKFAEVLGTNLVYENQLENAKRNSSIDMLDRLAHNISKLMNYNVSAADLITYDEEKIVYSKRIDERK